MLPEDFDSSADERTQVGDNTLRHRYRVLSDREKAQMAAIKDQAQILFDLVDEVGKPSGGSRELSLAKTKIEEAVMWAVKHVTA